MLTPRESMDLHMAVLAMLDSKGTPDHLLLCNHYTETLSRLTDRSATCAEGAAV